MSLFGKSDSTTASKSCASSLYSISSLISGSTSDGLDEFVAVSFPSLSPTETILKMGVYSKKKYVNIHYEK